MKSQFFKQVNSNIERPKLTKEYNTNIGLVKFDSTTNSFYSKNNDNVDFAVKYWFKEVDSFNDSVEPAIRFLFKNHNVHTKIYIDYSTAELLEGVKTHNMDNEIPD